jgi:hypothetical protein
MNYRINLYQGERLVSAELLDDVSLTFAKEYAFTAVSVGGVDRAEVCDAKGQLVFQHPRALHRA